MQSKGHVGAKVQMLLPELLYACGFVRVVTVGLSTRAMHHIQGMPNLHVADMVMDGIEGLV